MPDSEDREFIREKIMNKAAGRRYRIWKVCRLAASAVLFGLVAALFFVLGVKYLEPRFLPQETQPTESIHMGRDPEESHTEGDTSLEGMTEPDSAKESDSSTETGPGGESDSSEGTGSGEGPNGTNGEGTGGESKSPEGTGGQTASGEGINGESSGGGEPDSTETPQTSPEEFLRQLAAQEASLAIREELKEQETYLASGWYRLVSSTMKVINKGLVTISSVTQDTDWFHNPVSSANQSSGAVIVTTDAEVLILTDYGTIQDAEALTVTFASGKTVEARVKKADSITGIAIVSVSRGAVPDDVFDNIVPLVLGNSYQVTGGMPVVAAGCPSGHPGSVTAGMISLVQRNAQGADTAFQLLYSDIRMAETGGGFLFNMTGEIVGILTGYGEETPDFPIAIGISGLKGIIEKLSSGIDAAYLGIQGQNATAEIAEEYGMPAGIYVTRVVVDSPAYLAGLRVGDVIVSGAGSDLMTMQSLQRLLENYSTGDVISLTAYRGGQDEYVEMEFDVTLGTR